MKYVKTGHKKWKWKLTKQCVVVIESTPAFEHEYFNCVSSGNSSALTLREGYAIDGVTAYPDFKGLLPGAFVHDALLQAIDLELLPESYRKATHKEFYRFCTKNTWYRKLSARVAYTGLKLLHPIYHKLAN